MSLPAVVTLLLAAALLLRVAVPLWELLSGAPDTPSGAAVASAEADSYHGDVAALQALGLFANTPTGSAVAGPAAPPASTALSLRLEGVLLAGDAANSRAIIASNAQTGTYRVGDTLPAGAGVVLDSVSRDHVVINNRGQREALWLFPALAAPPAPPADATASGLAPAGLGQDLAALPLDQRVVKTAATLAEIIRVAPAQQNGQLLGYRLSPGLRLKEFVQLGFRENDIVTSVNGIALNDMANVPELYSLMNGATEVSFSLLRDGAPLTLNVALTPELPPR